jgi:hypothetical protein
MQTLISHIQVPRIQKDIRKNAYFFPQVCAGIGMHIGKRKQVFIKHNITVNMPFSRIKTLIPLVEITIPKENTSFGSKL